MEDAYYARYRVEATIIGISGICWYDFAERNIQPAWDNLGKF
ncbi:MAG: hypothetical protein NZ901_05875 [Geminocystis sp.]|nr:hypothetical protein [Geminocystis sp.]MCS7147705.1 hypothetical protein [Geminocystis sp.]MCX8077581.1 hypothetical protein [Geminocystis sp.]MDW8463874.1 hypothetical protein [Geminocystis sp.]